MSKRAVLTTLWWGWGILLILLLMALSLQSSLFGDDMSKVWQWFLPNLLPAMTMVGFTAYATPPPETAPPQGLFVMALAVSCIYLGVLTLSLVGTLFASNPLDFVTTSSLWLAPLQGFAIAGLSVFFVKK